MISESLLIVGTLIYTLAWLLPAFEHRQEMFGTTSVTVHQGWEAFWFALRPGSLSPGDILNTLSALTNFLLATTLVASTLTGHGPHIGLLITLIACALLNLNWWFRMDSGSLRIGYFWWACSFFLISAAFVPWHGTRAPWTSTQGIEQSALLLVSVSGFVVGILVEWRRISADTTARKETARDSGTSNADGPQRPVGGHDEPQGAVPLRRGSSWLLVAGVLAAGVTWLLLSLTPKTSSVDHPVPNSPHPVSPPHRNSSTPPRITKTAGDSELSLPATPTSTAASVPAVATAPDQASPITVALQQQALALRHDLEPFLNDPGMRAEALEAERSLAQGEDLVRRGDTASAADRFKAASSKLDVVRASAQRTLAVKRVADENTQSAAAARRRFTQQQAFEHAYRAYSRGQQFEARPEAAYRSRDYRNASSLYTSANREYDTVMEAIRTEEQLRAAREQEAREAARRLQEEQARALAQRQAQEREQRLREQNALRAKATGKIQKVQLNFVTYGGGNFPELEILVDFSVNGMTGVDGEVVVFLYSQQVGLFDRGKGPFEPLRGTGSDSNGVYAYAKYTPPYDSSQFSKFRLAIRTSRFTLPQGSNRVRAAVYLRTGPGGTLERDLDVRSEDILLNQP